MARPDRRTVRIYRIERWTVEMVEEKESKGSRDTERDTERKEEDKRKKGRYKDRKDGRSGWKIFIRSAFNINRPTFWTEPWPGFNSSFHCNALAPSPYTVICERREAERGNASKFKRRFKRVYTCAGTEQPGPRSLTRHSFCRAMPRRHESRNVRIHRELSVNELHISERVRKRQVTKILYYRVDNRLTLFETM